MEDYQVIWSLRAVGELDAIAEYIARDRPAAARRLIAAVQARVGKLAQFPFSGARFRRTRTGLYREISYKKYRIFYRPKDDSKTVVILRVWPAARDEPDRLG